MNRERIERLEKLEEKYWQGTLSYSEEQERAVLRAQIQEEARLEAAKRETNKQDSVSTVKGARSASVISSGKRPTLREAMSRAAKQIGLDGFMDLRGEYRVEGNDFLLAKTLCLVMAEVYMADPGYVIYACGGQMPAEQVQSVYAELRAEHIECLLRKIQKSRGKAVRYQRPYLRTMLYNVVFEYEAQLQAGIDADIWGT